MRLFKEVDRRGPLFEEPVRVDELRARIHHARTGFTPTTPQSTRCGEPASRYRGGPDATDE
jgi:hypothetical protein